MLRVAVLLSLLAAACFTKPDRLERTDPPDGADPDGNVDGLCVRTACEAATGKCEGGVCVIDGKMEPVMCPAGMPCRVVCDRPGECDYVLCRQATTCDVLCTADDTCKSGVGCEDADTCSIRCEGSNACEGSDGFPSLGCEDSTCTVTCNGSNACKNGVSTEPGGSCNASCCGSNACQDGTDACTVDNTCS